MISENFDRVIDALRRLRNELPWNSGLITSTGRYFKKWMGGLWFFLSYCEMDIKRLFHRD